MYECGKLKKVMGNKILFRVILEQCVDPINIWLALGIQKMSAYRQVWTTVQAVSILDIVSGIFPYPRKSQKSLCRQPT